LKNKYQAFQIHNTNRWFQAIEPLRSIDFFKIICYSLIEEKDQLTRRKEKLMWAFSKKTVAALSGVAMVVVFAGGITGVITDGDVRHGTDWFRDAVIAPVARFALYLNRETAVGTIAVIVLAAYGIYFLLKWRRLAAEELDRLEEESWF